MINKNNVVDIRLSINDNLNGCSINKCNDDIYLKNLCRHHYIKQLEENKINTNQICLVDNCSSPIRAKGMCNKHWQRISRNGDLFTGRRVSKIFGYAGYLYIWIAGRKITLHRHIMESHLKRKLSRDEVVHHINGNKLDNRIENLELLSNSEHTFIHHQRGDINRQRELPSG